MLTYKKLGDGVFHVTTEGKRKSLLTRYSILSDKECGNYLPTEIEISEESVTLNQIVVDPFQQATSGHSACGIIAA